MNRTQTVRIIHGRFGGRGESYEASLVSDPDNNFGYGTTIGEAIYHLGIHMMTNERTAKNNTAHTKAKG